jgi:four helix bundle protein
MRLASQMRDAARSAKQNIREGYKKGSFGEYIHGINISRGSLEELSGDVEDCREDGLIDENEFMHLQRLLRSADYLSKQYLKAVYKLKKQGKWKKPVEYYIR